MEVERHKVQRNLAEVHPVQEENQRLDCGEVEDCEVVALNRQAALDLHNLRAAVVVVAVAVVVVSEGTRPCFTGCPPPPLPERSRSVDQAHLQEAQDKRHKGQQGECDGPGRGKGGGG